MNDLIQINKFAKLHNGVDIFFVKTDYCYALFESLAQYDRDITLITGNSDYGVHQQNIDAKPRCVKRWFGQNMKVHDEGLVGLPIGIENHEECILPGMGVGWDHAKQKVKLLSTFKDTKPTRGLYANFSLETHPSRTHVAQTCHDSGNVDLEIYGPHGKMKYLSYENYVNNILDHQMVVCPRGNGVDCHRIWEVLYLNRVPIVKESPAMTHFKSLPILFVKSWDELHDIDLIMKKYDLVKNNSREMLSPQWWENKIKNG